MFARITYDRASSIASSCSLGIPGRRVWWTGSTCRRRARTVAAAGEDRLGLHCSALADQDLGVGLRSPFASGETGLRRFTKLPKSRRLRKFADFSTRGCLMARAAAVDKNLGRPAKPSEVVLDAEFRD